MRHLKTYKIFENNNPILCDIDIEWVRSHFDEDIFGKFDHHLDKDRGAIDFEKSKCLKLNNEIIGCYCLHESDIVETIERVEYWTNDGLFKNLEFFYPKEKLNIFKNKIGIFGDYLYIKPEYRQKGYADILIDYSKKLSDYNWGITAGEKAEKYWIENKGRIRICEYYSDYETKNIINSTLPR